MMNLLSAIVFFSCIIIPLMLFNKAFLHYKLIKMLRGEYDEDESLSAMADNVNFKEPSLSNIIFSLKLVETYVAHEEQVKLKERINRRIKIIRFLLIISLTIILVSEIRELMIKQ